MSNQQKGEVMAEKQEHTPGPWKWLPAFGRVESDKRIIAYIAGGVSEAELSEALKNGSLIAAATEMRKALERVEGEGHVPHTRTGEGGVTEHNPKDCTRCLVEAAIRKARGEGAQ